MIKPGSINQRKNTVASGIFLTALATLSFATAGFLANQIVDQHGPGVVIAFYESVFGSLFLLGIYGRELLAMPAFRLRHWAWVVAAGVFLSIGFAAFYSALQFTDLSAAAPITGAVPLVSYGAILVLLRGQERVTKQSMIGAFFVAVGVILVTISNA